MEISIDIEDERIDKTIEDVDNILAHAEMGARMGVFLDAGEIYIQSEDGKTLAHWFGGEIAIVIAYLFGIEDVGSP